MSYVLAALFLLFATSPALAHGGHPVAPEKLWAEWTPEPLLIALISLVVLAYGCGIARLWRRAGVGRGVNVREISAFGAGMAVLAFALVSPLEAATGTLLSAHMVQHVLLIAIAPPLILYGRPDAALAFALPPALRQSLSGAGWFRLAATGLRRLARPLPATFLHMLAIWIWHAPGPFQAALRNQALHDLEHASFLFTALLFWQSMLAAARSPSMRLAAVLAIVVTLIQGGFLGALITLTGRPLYPAYSGSALWGLTSMQDQQLAGLLMWVPAGAIYLIAGLVLAVRLIGFDGARVHPPAGSQVDEPVAPAR